MRVKAYYRAKYVEHRLLALFLYLDAVDGSAWAEVRKGTVPFNCIFSSHLVGLDSIGAEEKAFECPESKQLLQEQEIELTGYEWECLAPYRVDTARNAALVNQPAKWVPVDMPKGSCTADAF